MKRMTYLSTIDKKIFSLILPITLDNVLQLGAGLITMAMIGRLDVLAIDTVGLGTRIMQIIWAVFKGITIGAAVYVAQYVGAQDYRSLRRVIWQTFISTTVLSLLLLGGLYVLSPVIIRAFDPKPQLLIEATGYLKILALGIPFLAIMLVTGGVLQGMGNARTPMLVTMLMNLVNIGVGYTLIFGNFGCSSLNVTGAALATVVSQVVAAAIDLIILFGPGGLLKNISEDKLAPDIKQIADVYRVGIPAALESIIWQFAAIILYRAILTYGETTFAAHQLGLQAESISYMPALGFTIAATTFVGQALGARDKEMARVYLRKIMKCAIFLTIPSVLVFLVFPGFLMSLLTDKPEVIRLGSLYLMIMSLVELPYSAIGVMSGAMRGAGRTRTPLAIAVLGVWGVRVPLTLAFTYLLHYPITYIWLTIDIDLTFRFILCLIIFFRMNLYETQPMIEKGQNDLTR